MYGSSLRILLNRANLYDIKANMTWNPSKSHLYRTFLVYGVAGVLTTSLLAALISCLPVFLQPQVRVETLILRAAALAIFLMILGTGGMVLLLRPLAKGRLIHETELEQMLQEKARQYQAEYEERLAIEQDLRLMNSRYQSVVQSARDAIILVDPDGKIIDWNSAAETLLGYPADEVIGQPLLKIIPARAHATHQHAFRAFIDNSTVAQHRSRGQWPAKRKDGTEFPADITLSLFEMKGEKHLAAFLRDMSEIKNMQQALERSQAQYKSMIEDVIDAAHVAICITDAQFHVVWENLSAIKMWGIDRQQIIGRDKRELLKNHITEVIENGEDFVEKVTYSYLLDQHLENIEIHFPAKAGREESWALYSSRPIRVGFYAGGRIEQYVDITEQKKLLAQIALVAMTDELTGIYNRRGLLELGKRDIARARRTASLTCAIFVDVDHFKLLNDRYGHPVGDQVLKEMVQRIKKLTRDMDLFARYGGEEFAILLPDTSLEQAAQIAERIRGNIACQAINTDPIAHAITISLGVAQVVGENDNLISLLKRADDAMYRAKQNGRNRVECF
jgi:diguanylate cyclase (GGDEF)-like protein/PAS domain S-box-containing protein